MPHPDLPDNLLDGLPALGVAGLAWHVVGLATAVFAIGALVTGSEGYTPTG